MKAKEQVSHGDYKGIGQYSYQNLSCFQLINISSKFYDCIFNF